MMLDDPNPDQTLQTTVPRNQGREAMAYLTYSKLGLLDLTTHGGETEIVLLQSSKASTNVQYLAYMSFFEASSSFYKVVIVNIRAGGDSALPLLLTLISCP